MDSTTFGRLDRIGRECFDWMRVNVWRRLPMSVRLSVMSAVAEIGRKIRSGRRSIWPYLPEAIRQRIRLVRSRRAMGLPVFRSLPAAKLLEQRYLDIINGTPPSLQGREIELSSAGEAGELVKWARLTQQREHYADLITYLESFRYRFPSPPKDPFSEEYRKFWLTQYELMANKSYAVENEQHNFDLPSLLARPHPYNSRDQKVIASHIIAAGTILDAIPARPPAKILEMGVGFGNTALQIGLSGYDVTVLDIEEKHLQIVAERFKREGLQVECLHMDFMEIANVEEKYDAIIFYECFHHCIDHQRLLSILREKLADRGAIIFAGETIDEALPYAWGLNPTGQGIWSIRHHGWMELVFKQSYFVELLGRAGFSVSWNRRPFSANSWVFTARLC